jgi:hypothetical protein
MLMSHGVRTVTAIVLCDAADCEQFRSPRLQQEFLESVDSWDISSLRGFVEPPLELEHCHLQLAPGQVVPFIRSCYQLAHDLCTLLGSSTFHSTARPSAYPAAFPQAFASDVIPPRAPCGWHLLRRTNDLSWRGHTGLLRSRFGFGDRRRVRKLRRDLYGVNAGRAENRWPEVQCPFGSSVSASCAGSTYRRFHSLSVRTPIYLYLQRRQVRLPAYPRAFPLRGLRASRNRGECVSAPHQGRSELHRHPKRVLRLLRDSSFPPEDQSPELKARFLVNGSHLGPVVRGLDSRLGQKHPKGSHLPLQSSSEAPGIVLALMVPIDQAEKSRVPGSPLSPTGWRLGHVTQALELSQRPPPTGGKGSVPFARESTSRADQMGQAGLATVDPILIDSVAIPHQQTRPIVDQLEKCRFRAMRMDEKRVQSVVLNP